MTRFTLDQLLELDVPTELLRLYLGYNPNPTMDEIKNVVELFSNHNENNATIRNLFNSIVEPEFSPENKSVQRVLTDWLDIADEDDAKALAKLNSEKENSEELSNFDQDEIGDLSSESDEDPIDSVLDITLAPTHPSVHSMTDEQLDDISQNILLMLMGGHAQEYIQMVLFGGNPYNSCVRFVEAAVVKYTEACALLNSGK
ncbi:MAG: hypothetical protein ACRC0G_07810 [Fusobacteriaceae bacterium]